jgi:hypothetical protein
MVVDINLLSVVEVFDLIVTLRFLDGFLCIFSFFKFDESVVGFNFNLFCGSSHIVLFGFFNSDLRYIEISEFAEGIN